MLLNNIWALIRWATVCQMKWKVPPLGMWWPSPQQWDAQASLPLPHGWARWPSELHPWDGSVTILPTLLTHRTPTISTQTTETFLIVQLLQHGTSPEQQTNPERPCKVLPWKEESLQEVPKPKSMEERASCQGSAEGPRGCHLHPTLLQHNKQGPRKFTAYKCVLHSIYSSGR